MNDDQKQNIPPKPEFDTEEFLEKASERAAEKAAEIAAAKAAEIEEKTTKKVKEEIIQKLTESQPIPEDAPAWVKRGEKAPKSWDEVLQEAEVRAERKLTLREQEKLSEETRKKEEEQEKRAQSIEQWNKLWDSQLDDLEKQGKLSAVPAEIKAKLAKNEQLSEEERQNPALLERFELQKIALDKKEPNLKVAYYEHYSQKQSEPLAMPVFGATKSVSTPSRSSYSYEEIHGAQSYEDLLQELASK